LNKLRLLILNWQYIWPIRLWSFFVTSPGRDYGPGANPWETSIRFEADKVVLQIPQTFAELESLMRIDLFGIPPSILMDIDPGESSGWFDSETGEKLPIDSDGYWNTKDGPS
jgi:hypothetical protein